MGRPGNICRTITRVRSAYRWNEDGIAGICDRHQKICFAIALWNGRDPILKERLFGLTGNEGNHGEDVKECYYYLDSTPTHSYMKYPVQVSAGSFPYRPACRGESAARKRRPEFELLDTGVFEEGRYFDVFVEYAKARCGGHSRSHHRTQSRARSGAAPSAADDLVSEYMVMGTWRAEAVVTALRQRLTQ